MDQSRPEGAWLAREVQPTQEMLGPNPVPRQFDTATFSAIPHAGLRGVVRKYGTDFWSAAEAGLAPVFLGPVGTFKSHSAAVISRQVRNVANIKTDWCTVPVELTELERKRFETRTDERIQAWKDVPFLVMDDFALVKVGGWQYDVMLEIAMNRFERGRPTLWTGNIFVTKPGPDAIRETMTNMVGAQLTRRVLERSEGYRIYVGSVNNART